MTITLSIGDMRCQTTWLHWEELPVALAPDELGLDLVGSTVDDPENKSGLFSGKSPNNLLAFFYP